MNSGLNDIVKKIQNQFGAITVNSYKRNRSYYKTAKSSRFGTKRIFNPNNTNKLNTTRQFYEFILYVRNFFKVENTRISSSKDKDDVIISYPANGLNTYEFEKLSEITDRYKSMYNLGSFSLSNLPDFHENLLKPAGAIYESLLEGSNYIEDFELKKLLNKRLQEFSKCENSTSSTYYKNEAIREIILKDDNVENRCNRIFWSNYYLDASKNPIRREQLQNVINQLGDINLLKTFINPSLYVDNPSNDILFERILSYYSERMVNDINYSYQQFIFGLGSDIRKYVHTLYDTYSLYKRRMQTQSNFNSCSRYIDWSLLLNNIVTKCMSRNTTALFPIMFVLPQDTFKSLNQEFNFRDKNPIHKSTLFSDKMKFIGMINIIYQKNFLKDRGSRKRNIEKRFWTLFVFRILDAKTRHTMQSDPLTGNKEEYIILNYNGQVVNYGDIFGQVPITYMELNQLTQKYKMNCFFSRITEHQIPVLFMTPNITDSHKPIIDELGLIHVKVVKPPYKPDEMPSHSFTIIKN